MYQSSKLEQLELEGNDLRNEGVHRLFVALQISKSLTSINLVSNNIDFQDEALLTAVQLCWLNNKKLAKYNFAQNTLTDDGVQKLASFLPEAPHIQEVGMSEWITAETLTLFKEALSANRPKKGKKGGKKKK